MRKSFQSICFLLSLAAGGYAYSAPDSSCIEIEYINCEEGSVSKERWGELSSTGQILGRYRNGVDSSQCYYMGRLEGKTIFTYPYSSTVHKMEIYSQDQLLKETFYFPNGKLQKEILHHPSENTIVKEWYENEVLKSYEKWAGTVLSYAEYYDLMGQPASAIENGTGTRSERDLNGVLLTCDLFKKGEVEYRTEYYPNSSPKEVTPFKNELVNGIRKTYYPGGEPKTIETWVEGRQEGTTTLFQNGEKLEEIPYISGLKNGKGRVFKDGVTVIEEITWKNDKREGPSRIYIDNRVMTEWYYKGKKVSKGYYDSFHFKPEIE